MVDFRDRVKRVLRSSTKLFGEWVQYYPKNGGTYKLRGIFDHDYQAVDPDTEQLVSSNQPALGLNMNDFEFQIKQRDQVQIRNVRYSVIDSREDGQGGVTLLLHKVNESETVNKKSYQRFA